jgi:hypothetical protein
LRRERHVAIQPVLQLPFISQNQKAPLPTSKNGFINQARQLIQ